ncbi:MAG: MobP3 family relaxase [Synergistaceae bacterium]|nr:MobP3 family relaxase [Proteiniphilum sp.]MDD3963128.1 MobP3 family relaxase [Synergistaceae bacterium]
MARLVFISPYLKGEQNKARLKNRTRYVATRDGVELLRAETENLPITKRQSAFIDRITRSFPSTKEMLEYEDFQTAPSQKTASEFISQAWEQFVEPLDQRENYLDYVSHRPGVQLDGEHGLWNADGKVVNLTRAVEEVANHPGIVWTPVVSLRREDAERLGYTDAANWRALVNSIVCDIAKGYKIHPDHLKWYAAFHGDKEKHVHIHMVVFSSDPKEGYLTKQGIREIKSAFAKQIYRQDMISVYARQTEYRAILGRDAEQAMSELILQMRSGITGSDRLEQLTAQLAEGLTHTSGRKVYGYLPPRLKSIVDEIVDELSKDERVASAYALWQEMRDEVCRTYDQTPQPRLPLSRQKEFKPVRNMVIREAQKLADMTFTFEDDAMDDEPESSEQAAATPTAPRAVYRQAADYRQAKRVLTDEYASSEERSAALAALERLWTEGFSIAAHQLGKVYRDGVYVQPDADIAEQWFRRSADAGNDCSEYALGKLLLEQNHPAEAVSWLKRAAEHQNQYARYRLGKLCLLGEAVPKDIKSALDYLTAAAEQGNQYAQYTLGKLYLMGQDAPQDKATATRWFMLSAAQGNSCARFFLERMAQFRDPSVGMALLRMFHHMSRIFSENTTADSIYHGIQIDKKRRRKLQQKRLAAGHKPDDHEDPQMKM